MTEHDRHERQQERQGERDAIINGIYDAIERGAPTISTESLLQRTADSAHCDVARVLSALRRLGFLIPAKKSK